MTRRTTWAGAGLAACALALTGARAQTFTPARDELLAARAVTVDAAEAWAAEFLANNPDVAAYDMPEQGHVVVTTTGGGELELYLDTLIDRLSVRGVRRERVLAEFEAGVEDAIASAQAVKPDTRNVLPIVRHRDVAAALAERAGDEGGGLVRRDLPGDVAVLLAYDAPTGLAVMAKDSLGLAGVPDDDALALAMVNLRERAGVLTWEPEGNLRAAAIEGDLESSVLLLDDVWAGVERDLGGPVAVAVPTTGTLYAGRADKPEDVAALRKLIDEAALDPYSVSGQVFVRKDGSWQVLP